VLDNIRSVENVGAIFRTADAVGVTKIYLCGITPGPLDRFDRPRADIHKSALGAELSVPWERIEKVGDISHEYELVALEQDFRAVDYKKYIPTKDFALILGPEVEGLSKEVLDMCDKIISIPMHGKKESLNVSVAAGVALYKLLDL
jgi:23S rRNA (guanosine2251-2'-O)-methyltransferase